MNIKGHFETITRHKLLVMKYCFACGLYEQGLAHDLSKYSPTEFIPGCIYYQGDHSPNEAERKARGYTSAWLHHKGRNKHHLEYWIDYSTTTPRDYASLFAQVAKGTLVSAEASAEMLAIFRQQHYNTMLTHDFPQFYLDCEETGEPELIWVASKSGSMNACRNDGGIVHTPYGEYVIVLMNKDFHDIIEYNDHPSMVYGARVSRMILDQVLACEGELYK